MIAQDRDYMMMATAGCICAAAFAIFNDVENLPVLGKIPLLPVTVLAALLGWPLNAFLRRRSIGKTGRVQVTIRRILRLAGMGAGLALLPIAIDLAIPFPRDLNLPVPGALFFYPAIAVVAETVFHLAPLTALALLLPRGAPAIWLMLPVVFVEPLFQVMFLPLQALQSWLVIANVSAVSATQLWLFRNYGFAAMIGLRLAFYLVWHIVWGTARLALIFP